MTNGTVSPSSPGWTTARPAVAGVSRRIFRTCLPGLSRRSAGRQRIGQERPSASRTTNSRLLPTTARSRVPPYSTGRCRLPISSPTTPRPRTRWALPAPTASKAFLPVITSRFSRLGADKLGYKECHTGNMAINSAERDGRMACQQTGFCFQGCKWGAKWSTLYTEIPKGEETGKLEVRPNSACGQDRARPKRKSHERRLCRQGWEAAKPKGAHRLRCWKLNRKSPFAAQLGFEHVPRRLGQFVRPSW